MAMPTDDATLPNRRGDGMPTDAGGDVPTEIASVDPRLGGLPATSRMTGEHAHLHQRALHTIFSMTGAATLATHQVERRAAPPAINPPAAPGSIQREASARL